LQDLFAISVLVILTLVSWLFVLSKSTRRSHSKPAAELFRMNKEQRESFEALTLASSLVIALMSSIVLIFILIAAIIKLLR
jgi:hypothetical protein